MFTLRVNKAIYLRMLSARDKDALFSITDQSRDYLKNWLPWLDSIKSADDSLQFIKGTFTAYNNRTGITSGIFLHDELVGVVGFNTLDFKNKIGTIGYWLNKKDQGKGVMTETVRAITSYGFNELKLNRIEISAAEENYGSRNIAERLTYKKEGHIRDAEWLYDHYVDHIIYGMLERDWDVNGE